MPDAALPRTGLTPLLDSGADTTDIFRHNLRALAAFLEASGLVWRGQGLLSARPAASIQGGIYKPTDVGLEGVFYYDTGAAWQVIGASALTDAAASVGSLRTLGGGSTQAAGGNHQHAATDLISGSIPAARYGAATVPVAAVNATGTPSSTTWLRGDGQWTATASTGTLNSQTFTGSGTWTSGSTTNWARFIAVGGGGGSRYGGGGGGEVKDVWLACAPSTGYAVTIGAGGIGGASPTAGGATSVGALVSAAGGQAVAGFTGGASGSGMAGGVAAGGSIQAGGGGAAGPGGPGMIVSSGNTYVAYALGGNGGPGILGYGGGGAGGWPGAGSGSVGKPGPGGGTGGVNTGTGTAGTANTGGGGGGGGSGSGGTGGDGGSGIVIVQWLS